MSPRSVLSGIGALLALQGAAGPAEAALPSAAASSAAELRQQIDATPARERERMIELARQGLAVPLAPAEKIWFLERMAGEQLRLRRWADGLTSARDGLAMAVVGTAWYVRFAELEALALQGLGRHEDSLKSWDANVAPHLEMLLKSTDPMDRRRALNAQRTRGMALVGLKRHGEAMELLTQVLRGFDALKVPGGQAETLHVIASLRSTTGDLGEALRAEQQAIDIAKRGQVTGLLPRLHSLMSYLQASAGNTEAQLRELTAANDSAIEEGDPYVQGVVMFNQSDVAMQRGDWAQSLRLSAAARPLFLRIGDLNMADLCLANQGIALNRTGHPEGIALIRRAFDALAGRPGQEVTLAAIQKALAEELAFNRSFEQAYAAQLEYQRHRDALHQADNQKRIAEAEAAYQADRRQRQIESLEHEHVEQQRHRWLWTLVGLTCSALPRQ